MKKVSLLIGLFILLCFYGCEEQDVTPSPEAIFEEALMSGDWYLAEDVVTQQEFKTWLEVQIWIESQPIITDCRILCIECLKSKPPKSLYSFEIAHDSWVNIYVVSSIPVIVYIKE